ncbi:MAG TPA: hypothetical protein PLL71_06650 [Agriterribacter sp.]|nr:hypothetical protein [Agriterribacter sp.]
MNITAEQYQRIIRFLDAEMESDEMNAFEKELAANPEMRKQLDFEQSLRDDLALQNITSLPDAVPESGTMIASATPGKLTGMRKWWAVGAAIIAVLALLSIFRPKPALTPDIANINGVDTAQQTDTTQNETEQPPIVIAEPAKDSAGTIDPVLLFKQYFEKDALPEQYPLFLAEALTDYESGNYKTLHQLDLNNLPQL